MDTMDSYSDRVIQYQKAFPEEHANLLIGIANDAMATFRDRVRLTGKNAQGENYREYRKDYLEFKKKSGKYHGFTDFSFTNRMWNNIKLISDNTEIFSGIARITATGVDEINKLQKNTRKFGQIVDLSKQEIEDMRKDYEEGLLDIHRKYGLL